MEGGVERMREEWNEGRASGMDLVVATKSCGERNVGWSEEPANKL